MVKYQQEFLSLVEDEVAPLAILEWDESGHPTQELHINWDEYFRLEEAGHLKFFTARKEKKWTIDWVLCRSHYSPPDI